MDGVVVAAQQQDDPGRLSTRQVAERLGVRVETVYAYVSRGLLHSTRTPDGRGSSFDAAEVAELARHSARQGGGAARAEPRIVTALTSMADGRLRYRGFDVGELARTHSFESVATLLWTGTLTDPAPFMATAETVALARTVAAALPETARLPDRLRVIPSAVAAADPLRFNLHPDAVVATAQSLIATMVEALPARGTPPRDDRHGGSLAARLWVRLTERPPSPPAVRALNAALVVLADHDLAASTVAARVAASTRAHPYAVVASALGALDGPLHGAAGSHAYRLLADAIAGGDPVAAYAERLRTEGRVEGFGPLANNPYPDGDPRAQILLGLLYDLDLSAEVRAAANGLVAAAQQRAPRHPNVDFALPLLAHACGMTPDAPETIFAVARTAGWIAHALEEYREPPLRFRFRGIYQAAPTRKEP